MSETYSSMIIAEVLKIFALVLCAVPVVSLIAAVFLRTASSWVAKQYILYRNAYVTTLYLGILAVALQCIASILFVTFLIAVLTTGSSELSSGEGWISVALFLKNWGAIPVYLLVASKIVAMRSKNNYGKSFQIVLMQAAMVCPIVLGPVFWGAEIRKAESNLDYSMSKMNQIGFAMHAMAEKKEQLPARAITSGEGKPLLSWRVAILPYLDQETGRLFKRFKLDESWDSPHNIKLLAEMPLVFKSPGSTNGDITKSNYVMPTGEETVFEGFKTPSAPSTIFISILEVEDSHAVPWTKPADYDVAQYPEGLQAHQQLNLFPAFISGTRNSDRTRKMHFDIAEDALNAFWGRGEPVVSQSWSKAKD